MHGDAIIADCDIYWLPKKLVATGTIEIKRCHNITKIIGILQAESILISDCNNFTEISNNLKDTRILKIFQCNNFVKLPDNLRISELSISNSQIAQLPEDIVIFTLFCLNNCPKITSLPKQFQMPKKLPIVSIISITSCNNIIIPKGLRVLGTLTINNCDNFISLPEDMNIGNLNIYFCMNFQHMPEKITITGNITIKNCKKLTEFPERWLDRHKPGAFISSNHKIKCINTGIDEKYTKYFMSKYYLHNVTFTAELNYKITTLIELINFWQSKAENKENIKIEQLTTAETHDLLNFCDTLTRTNSYLNEYTRKNLSNKVITIFHGISNNNWFKVEAFKIIQNAFIDNYGNTDRVLIGLGQLEFLPRLYNLIEGTGILQDN